MSNGINNPSGIFIAATGPIYLALAPLASKIAAPNGIVQQLTETLVSLATRSDVAPARAIPALTLVYALWSFVGSSALSVAGQAMSRSAGLDHDHPRKHRSNMEGVPLRLMSAHHALIEIFPLFAAAACFAQVLAPGDQQIRNLLGLHVLLKTFVFYPSYVAGVSPVRSLSHILSTSAIIRVLWLLAN
ncbi:hypothetical protein N7457_005550 [Penicillium paradoxum]|uniref:uncharacterized protein n=1 Tax=Penicillium paradoxum TaxID=176176 RepID=UPI002548EAAD|nr:uncharacterized protein N7457_005550 [Penicillium paradoxum]KAJ5780390.1 hypothetical protein N7457_005550 [Penicillium paradoxum]